MSRRDMQDNWHDWASHECIYMESLYLSDVTVCEYVTGLCLGMNMLLHDAPVLRYGLAS